MTSLCNLRIHTLRCYNSCLSFDRFFNYFGLNVTRLWIMPEVCEKSRPYERVLALMIPWIPRSRAAQEKSHWTLALYKLFCFSCFAKCMFRILTLWQKQTEINGRRSIAWSDFIFKRGISFTVQTERYSVKSNIQVIRPTSPRWKWK